MRSITVALGLGSNLKNPIQNLRTALTEIKKLEGIRVLKLSSIYESEALLPNNATADWNKTYLNAAVLCQMNANISASDLLEKIKNIEKKMGRNDSERWAPRLIDIDILYWSEANFQNAQLQIPHSGLVERPFALLPLMEVWGEVDLVMPTWSQPWVLDKPFNTVKSRNLVWPQMIGILNITEDSFSDGGQLLTEEKIYQHAKHLLITGADILDIGAESTRPGAVAVSVEQEVKNITLALNVLQGLKKDFSFQISLDSRNADVVAAVVPNFEIDFLNDVTGFSHATMKSILSESKAKAFVMHSLSIPPNAQNTLSTEMDPCLQLVDWWRAKSAEFEQAGISSDRIVFDPGIGFGKTKLQSLYILNHLEKFASIRNDILIGHSRKSFQTYFSDRDASVRDLETALVTKDLNLAYTQYLRVHDIETQKIALRSSL